MPFKRWEDGGVRIFSFNLVEVETIKFKITKILNMVFYPNTLSLVFVLGLVVVEFFFGGAEYRNTGEGWNVFKKMGGRMGIVSPNLFEVETIKFKMTKI